VEARSLKRFKPMNDMPQDTVAAAHKVADTLNQRGHHHQAGMLREALSSRHPRSPFLSALREACQVVLTAIEAIDPVSAMMVEELRLEVDKRLTEEPVTPT
jgi:hypothetical protein